jgi:hypothetical protein
MSPITDMYSWNNNHAWLPLKRMYEYDPVPAGLAPDKVSLIHGAEHCIWTEDIENEQRLDYHAYARNCALAEVNWTPQTGKNWNDFSAALSRHYTRLEHTGVNFFRDTSIAPDTSLSRFAIIPRPAMLKPGDSSFTLNSQTVINVSDSTRWIGEYLAAIVNQSTGFALKVDISQQARADWEKLEFRTSHKITIHRAGQTLTVSGGKDLRVNLFNQLGRIVATGDEIATGKIRLSLSGLPAGVYICACRTQTAAFPEYVTIWR